MGSAFRFAFATWFRHVLCPQLEPYVVAAARSGLALVWKIVLVVELLGRPNGVGYAISYYFQLFDVRAILGYSLAFTIVVLRSTSSSCNPWRRMPGAGASPPLEIDILRKLYRNADGRTVEAVRDLRLRSAAEFRVPHRPFRSRQDHHSACLLASTATSKAASGLTSAICRSAWCSRSRAFCRGGPSKTMSAWRCGGRTRRSLDPLFAELDLEAWRNRFPGELSVGMARRAALARALAIEPIS